MKGYWRHTHQIIFSSCVFFGIFWVIPLTNLSTGFIKPKITKTANKKNSLQKNYIFVGWTSEFGEAGLAKNIDEIMVNI